MELARRILLVDDDDDLRILSSHVLQDLGYVVDTAARVTEGKILLSAHVYDLVITDARLPDGSGHAIADMAKMKETLVVILTGYEREALEYEYLFKPIRPDELARAVHRYLGTKTLT
jgi:DNA-binding NtrC family response regulator